MRKLNVLAAALAALSSFLILFAAQAEPTEIVVRVLGNDSNRAACGVL